MQKLLNMKKILLLCSFLALANVVSARTVKLTMSDYFTTDASNSTFVVSDTDKGITLTAGKGTYGAKSGYFANGGDVRVQFGATLKVTTTDPHITQIEFILSSQGKERLPELQVDNGVAQVTNDPDYTAMWDGNAQTVTFTVGNNSYGSKSNEKGQLCFTAIRIVTDGSGADDDDTPDLTKEYPLTQGRAFYWETSSGCSNFSVELYSDGIYFGTVDVRKLSKEQALMQRLISFRITNIRLSGLIPRRSVPTRLAGWLRAAFRNGTFADVATAQVIIS